jgi:hypothetical protein
MLTAVFEEWPLEGVFLKRVTEGDLTTFQLQFAWASGATHGPENSATKEHDNGATPEAVDDANKITTTPDTELKYGVKRILHHRYTKQGLQYLVEWAPTWEPAKELENGEAYLAYVACTHMSQPPSKPKRGRGRPRKSTTAGAVPGG